MSKVTGRLRHGKERLYGTAMLVFGIFAWIVVGSVVFAILSGAVDISSLAMLAPALFYLGAFLVYLFVKRLLMRAYIFGHYVMVGPNQFPELDSMVASAAGEIGMNPVPTTFIRNSHGVMNAMAVRLFGGRYVWLNSALLDADTDAQLRFVIGHELGHHAFGHLNFWTNFLRMPGWFVPFLGPAYSRARELSCDRVGAYLAHDVESSVTALQMLACGSARLNARMNPAAFQEQEARVPALTGFILHAFSFYPRLTQRVVAVRTFLAGPLAADRGMAGRAGMKAPLVGA